MIRVTIESIYEVTAEDVFPDGVPKGVPAGYSEDRYDDEEKRAALWLDYKLRHDPFEEGAFERDFAEKVKAGTTFARASSVSTEEGETDG
jgi:hypothetical protein